METYLTFFSYMGCLEIMVINTFGGLKPIVVALVRCSKHTLVLYVFIHLFFLCVFGVCKRMISMFFFHMNSTFMYMLNENIIHNCLLWTMDFDEQEPNFAKYEEDRKFHFY